MHRIVVGLGLIQTLAVALVGAACASDPYTIQEDRFRRDFLERFAAVTLSPRPSSDEE